MVQLNKDRNRKVVRELEDLTHVKLWLQDSLHRVWLQLESASDDRELRQHQGEALVLHAILNKFTED